MRSPYIKPILSIIITFLVTFGLSVPLGPLPALGPLLSPIGGVWSAASYDTFQTREQYSFPGLKADVTVIRDKYGVPHIFAQNDEDAAFVLGWLQGHERLTQMDLQRRVAAGTLSELVGPDALEDDEFMREVGLQRAAKASLAAMDPNDPSLRVLQAFANGVNTYIASIEPNNLPLEYKLLGVKHIAPWTVLDEATFAKYMGWDLSNSFDDLYMTTLVEKMGVEKVSDLFPLDRPYESPIVPTWPPNETPLTSLQDSSGLDIAITDIMSRAASAGVLNEPGSWRGSNNWAIAGSRTVNGKPIMASDPHLGYQLPSLWYAAHIVTPNQDVYGVTLLGVPFVVIGHTQNIAWGLTNTQADVIDFFTEIINPDNETQYWHDGQWNDMQVLDEVINVRGGQPVHYQVRLTLHGPIINKKGFSVAMQWTGAQPTFEVRSLYKLNHSNNYNDFVAAMRDFQVPAQNIAYADSDGNIAIWSAGLYPIRKNGDGRTVVDGASGDYDWTGFIPFEDEPHVLNPDSGYVLSANQRPAPADYPYFLGWQWDPSYRARRIQQIVSACNPCTQQDMESLQYDSKDTLAESILPVMLQHVTPQDDLQKSAMEQMQNWDYFTTTDSIAATIWGRWLEDFRKLTWQDDWKVAGFQFKDDMNELENWGAWGFNGDNEYQPPLELWEYMVKEQPLSPYFDDLLTPNKTETRDDLIQTSFDEVIHSLQLDYGSDLNGWRWGDHHKLEIKHLLDIDVLNRGGEPIPGDGNSPNGQSFGETSDGGPSWRMVVDFSDVSKAVGIYPGGQSGSALSVHYDDLIPFWVKGDYIPLLFPKDPQELDPADVQSTLLFQPK